MCEVFNITLPCLSFQVTMDSEEERIRPGNSHAGLSNLQMRALNDSMSNLLNTGLEAIHQRLDELQGRPTQSRTRTRRDHPKRNSRSDLEIREESYDDDRSINQPRRVPRHQNRGDVNPFGRNERTNDGLDGLKLKIPNFDGKMIWMLFLNGKEKLNLCLIVKKFLTLKRLDLLLLSLLAMLLTGMIEL